jgi:hypothetical protein
VGRSKLKIINSEKIKIFDQLRKRDTDQMRFVSLLKMVLGLFDLAFCFLLTVVKSNNIKH